MPIDREKLNLNNSNIAKVETRENGSNKERQWTFEEVRKRTLITQESDIPPIEVVVHIDDARFAIEGDISFISGIPKSGKSTVCQFAIATAFMKSIPGDLDTLGIKTKFCNGKDMIYIDTEQPTAITKATINKICNLIGVDKQPENLHYYNWREFDWRENNLMLEALFQGHSNAHLWVIDGISDLIPSANDEEKGNEIVRRLMRYASEYRTTIILLIHENIAGGKARGHVGSEMERKCGGSISIKKDKEKQIHHIESKYLRGTKDFENIYFEYDATIGRMRRCDKVKTEQLRKTKEEKKTENLQDLARKCFADGEIRELEKSRFIELIINYESNPFKPDISSKTANRRLNDMITHGFVSESKENHKHFKWTNGDKINEDPPCPF